jgi:quinoprotein glucose dehydrogenase
MKIRTTLLSILLFSMCVMCTHSTDDTGALTEKYARWSDYLGDPGRSHFSSLTQITPENVHQLRVAWTYSTPDSGQMQMNPVIVDSVLYGINATLRVVALNARTGEELWTFGDPIRDALNASRGVAYWSNGNDSRILFTAGPRIYALDARTGQPVTTFGENGAVDLHTGLPASAQKKYIVSTTPGAVFDDLIVMPVRVSEGADAAPGDIRAFNVITGDLEWTFHTIPHPEEPGYETWENREAYLNIDVGGANNWCGMSVDVDAGIVYVPTGSASPDFYGGKRLGSNLYANCLLALDARTGGLIWHYQFTHHDILDRDLPTPPNLITVTRDGKQIKAVAQPTKQGYIFVFDRLTGRPLFDIEEVEVPRSRLTGEEAWPTQPVPVLPKPFARQSADLTERDISPFAPNRDELLAIFRATDRRMYAPPDTNPVLLLPGYDGGAEWGGAAADPEDGLLYVNSNEMPWILRMQPVETPADASPGRALYLRHCASCHLADLQGNPKSGFPSLTNIKDRLDQATIANRIKQGRGMMTGHPHLSESKIQAIVSYLYGEEPRETADSTIYPPPLPYRHLGYEKFLDDNGLPAISPPWGTLHAIDLNTGAYRWSVPLGDTPSLTSSDLSPTGTENYGGPLVTASGLLFIAATKDGYFRAFDKYNGQPLWETRLPYAAFATPATYAIDGVQYIALACGGGKLGTAPGNTIIAFALEEDM